MPKTKVTIGPMTLADKTTFMYYSKSADAKVGKGKREWFAPGDSAKNYDELGKIKNWRKVLSAFYVPAKPLEYNGKMYATREHAYHAAKFPDWPEYQRLFEIDSGSKFAKDPALAKAAGGKSGTVKVKGVVIYQRPKKYTACPERMKTLSALMEEVMECEFVQDEHARRVLLATGDAVLTHLPGRRQPVVVERGLMRVRDGLRARK